jgi:hypothetical protein
MPVKFVNDIQTRITDVGGIAAGASSVSITAGDGAKILAQIPDINAGDYCYGVFKNDAGNRETVKVTGVSVNTLTLGQRAADTGDVAREWAQNDILHFCLSKSALEAIGSEASAALATVASGLATAQAEIDVAESAITDLRDSLDSDILTFSGSDQNAVLTETILVAMNIGTVNAGDLIDIEAITKATCFIAGVNYVGLRILGNTGITAIKSMLEPSGGHLHHHVIANTSNHFLREKVLIKITSGGILNLKFTGLAGQQTDLTGNQARAVFLRRN